MGVEYRRMKFTDSKIEETEVKPHLHNFDIESLEESIEAYEMETLTTAEDQVKLSTV